MRVRIHRGAHEIGGNCIEVEEDGDRMVLDLGRPLSAGWAVHHHTSGHAHVDDLGRLVGAFSDARVVPIHSEATDRFADHFPRVEEHADHEWWEV